MSVLITGGAGFIGSHLVDRLVERGHRVRILDNLTDQVHRGQKPRYLNPGAEFICGDVRDRGTFHRALEGMGAVVHLAAAVGVSQSQYEIKRYFDVNVGGTANLADILANERHDVEKVVLAGSMTSYGEGCAVCSRCGPVRPNVRRPEDVTDGIWEPRCPLCDCPTRSIPTGEDAQLRADNMYAVTKYTQEKLVRHVSGLTGVRHVIMRLFNVFGPRQSLSNPYTGVSAIFIARLKGGASPIVFEDGLQTRDFIWVTDVADTLCDALETDRADNAVLNLGSGRPVSIRELAEHAARLMKVDCPPQITGRYRHGDIRHCTAEVARARDMLSFQPRTTFEEGLAQLIRWSLTESSRDDFATAVRDLEHHRMLS